MSPFDPNLDHYAVLGVSPGASADEIKKAYRKLAVQYHPDSTGGDKAKEARFKEVSRAYEVLGDQKKRAHYDAMRAGTSRFGAGAAGGGAWDLGELFSQVFTQGGARGQAGQGTRQSRAYQFRYGSPLGDVDIFGPEGSVRRPRPRRGTSQRRPARDKAADAQERKVAAADGSPLVQRGADIHSDLRIQIDQAILGAAVDVPTLSGKARVKVPPGTGSGIKLRLKGKGAPQGGADGARGDHFVTIHIDVPRGLDDEAAGLLAELMRRVRGQQAP